MDTETVRVIVQAGAVGLALVALALVGYTVRIMSNHLIHVTEILGRIEGAIEALADRLSGRS